MQEISYKNTFNYVWLLGITIVSLSFSYFFLDGYFFNPTDLFFLGLGLSMLWLLWFAGWYGARIPKNRTKFIIDAISVSKLTYDTQVSIAFKDISYLAIYRSEGEFPNSVETKDDQGPIEFEGESFNYNLSVLLVTSNQGEHITIKMKNLSRKNLRFILKGILQGVEPVKKSFPDYDILEMVSDGYSLHRATYESMIKRNPQVYLSNKGLFWYVDYAQSKRKSSSILITVISTIFGLCWYFLNLWADSLL